VSVVGFAAAGGRSRRMGRDKARLPWGDTDLLGHALARLRAVADEVRVLSGPELRHGERGVPVLVDPSADLGPLGGLLAALESASGRAALVLAIDLPLVPAALLAHLHARGEGVDAVVPVSPEGPEPLCALYGPACLEPVRRSVRGGRLQMTAFWRDVRVRTVEGDEVGAFGDPESLFLNVNGPADYERARRLVR
jgi:molybdopterin-guanine dinucleotide biosynthesis protein A